MAYKRIKKSQLARYPRPLQGGVRVLSGRGYRSRGLAQQYQDALDKANAENEKRYRQILGGYDQLHGRVMGDLAGVGQQQAADINRQYRNYGSDVYNKLVGRGFGNSSLIATQQQGVMRERAEAQRRLQEGLMRQRAMYDTNITQGKLGVMERRTDAGPDSNQMLQLMQGLGRGGYGLPAYGGGYGGGFGLGYGSPTMRDAIIRGQMMANRGLAQHFMGGMGSPARGYGRARSRPRKAMKQANTTNPLMQLMNFFQGLGGGSGNQRSAARNPYAFSKAMHSRSRAAKNWSNLIGAWF